MMMMAVVDDDGWMMLADVILSLVFAGMAVAPGWLYVVAL